MNLQLIEADPHLVAFSLNNPRKRRGLDVDSLSALASSIRTQGLAQPILVRPLPGDRAADTFADREDGKPLAAYELVCGERRLRASRMADMEAIPMFVRQLTDEEALELQLVENIEREDLDPMEEAEGFELLRTKLGYSIEQITERIGRGKGTSYVYKTMKLLALTPESREAMYEGHLGRSTGLLVARYPAEQQAAVVEFIKRQAINGEPAPFRHVKSQVDRHFNLVLDQAVWVLSDADLVAAAGACSTCPKRTGAHAADLFGDDVNTPDSCTDPDCFASKRVAHVERVKAQAAKDGIKVIDGAEAEAAVPMYAGWLRGYSRVSDTAYTEKGSDGTEREVTFEDALRAKGKKAPKPRILIHPRTGEAIKVITEDLAEQLQKDAPDYEEPGGMNIRPGRTPQQDDRPEDVRALDQFDVHRAVTLRIFDAVRGRDRTDAEVLLMAKALFAASDWEVVAVTDYLHWDADLDEADYQEHESIVCAKLDALPPAEVAFVATLLAIEAACRTLNDGTQTVLQIASTYGVDVLAVRDKVAEDLERQDTGAADDDQEDEDDDHAVATPADEVTPADASDPIEPEPHVGARVRMKDSLGRAGSKHRKISGREGVLMKELPAGDWMFKSDGGKDQARVARSEFVVLGVLEAEAERLDEAKGATGAGGDDTVDPPDAWPFPVAKKAAKSKKAKASAPPAEAQQPATEERNESLPPTGMTIDPVAAWPFPKPRAEAGA